MKRIYYNVALKLMKNRVKSRDFYKNQMERNNADTARKNKELIDKIQDLDIVKRKYEEAITGNPDLIANQSNPKVD